MKICNLTIEAIIKISQIGLESKDILKLLSTTCKLLEESNYLKVVIVHIKKRQFNVITKDKIESLNRLDSDSLDTIYQVITTKVTTITKNSKDSKKSENIFIPIISPINFDIFGIVYITSKNSFTKFEIEHLNMCIKSLSYSIYNLNTKILKDNIESKLVTLNENLTKRVEEETQKKLEQERLLVQQSKLALMGEMIGNIAHQWRQPLNSLGLVLQNIKMFYDRDKLTKELMENLSSNGMNLIDKMSTTISDFMDFFKPKSEKEKFLLRDSIEKTAQLIAEALNHYNIKIQIDIDKNLAVEGYVNEFSQVILNLLSNSRDAFIENSIKERVINIKAIKDKSVILEVTDNAGGIDKAILNRVFEPYFSTKEDDKGSGIGLYMSKVILENMDANIEVFSKNGNTTFKIILRS